MKVGDLVRLSSYGKSLVRTRWIHRDDVGVVIKVRTYDHGYVDEYEVHWSKSKWTRSKYWMQGERLVSRKDLKYAK